MVGRGARGACGVDTSKLDYNLSASVTLLIHVSLAQSGSATLFPPAAAAAAAVAAAAAARERCALSHPSLRRKSVLAGRVWYCWQVIVVRRPPAVGAFSFLALGKIQAVMPTCACANVLGKCFS